MGDGEDIGSDLDGDEEEEEDDEDGGFVVPDGYGSDDREGDMAVKSKKRKLEQVTPPCRRLACHDHVFYPCSFVLAAFPLELPADPASCPPNQASLNAIMCKTGCALSIPSGGAGRASDCSSS